MGEAALSARSDNYRPRSPQTSLYYQCIEDNFEHVYDERFSRQHGFFRPFVKDVIYRYLDCGDLHSGYEQLLSFSCKRRHFCPSCHQKRVVEFGEWLCVEVVKKVPHRHVLTYPQPGRADGYYSNVCRGKRQKEKTDDTIPCIIKSDAESPAKRRSWTRLRAKVALSVDITQNYQTTYRAARFFSTPFFTARPTPAYLAPTPPLTHN